MPLLAPPPIELNEPERDELQQLVRRHQTPQQISLRASIILLATEGKNHRDIARDLGISPEMARLWRNRWLALKEQEMPVTRRLVDLPRPGEPMTFSSEQILELFVIACEKPEAYGRPSAIRWRRN